MAQTATTGSVTMISQGGDYIGGGTDFVFDSPNTILFSGGLGGVTVGTPTPGAAVFGYTIDFAPPSGQQLHVGEYDNAQRDPFQPAGSPGVSVYGDGRGCNMDYGRFVVKDIHIDGSGNVDRFWALFEQHCENPNAPALFGEVRLNEPSTGAAETVVPAAIDWPGTPIGSTGVYAPVTVVAGPTGAAISSVALTGADPADFVIESNGCVGAVLPAGANCQIHVALTPKAAGDRTAALAITDSLNSVTTVALALLV